MAIDPTAVIDRTAIIHTDAQIGRNVKIGPHSIIGEKVVIGDGTEIGAGVIIETGTEIGRDCKFFHYCSIGTVPQDLKFGGEETKLVIGDRNTFREFCTANRGTKQGGGKTEIGSDNFFMAYVHIAHDCRLGSHIVMANAATLAGHIKIDDHAIIGGLVGVHQFVRIGGYVMIGGCSAVSQDVPPYMSAVGNRARLFGLNLIGLKRHGFSEKTISDLRKVYKLLFRRNTKMSDALKQIEEQFSGQEITCLLDFIKGSDAHRGICQGRSDA